MGKFLHSLVRVETRSEEVVTFIGAAVVAAMVIIVCIDVFLRKVFNSTLMGSYEYVSLLFVGVVFLGLAYGQAHDEQIQVPVLYDRIPPKARRPILGIVLVISLLLFGTITWFSAIAVVWAQQIGDTVLGAVQVQTWWARLFVPVGTGLLSLRLLIQIVRVIRGMEVFEARSGITESIT